MNSNDLMNQDKREFTVMIAFFVLFGFVMGAMISCGLLQLLNYLWYMKWLI